MFLLVCGGGTTGNTSAVRRLCICMSSSNGKGNCLVDFIERKPDRRDWNKCITRNLSIMDLAMFGDVTTSDTTRPVSLMTSVMERLDWRDNNQSSICKFLVSAPCTQNIDQLLLLDRIYGYKRWMLNRGHSFWIPELSREFFISLFINAWLNGLNHDLILVSL